MAKAVPKLVALAHQPQPDLTAIPRLALASPFKRLPTGRVWPLVVVPGLARTSSKLIGAGGLHARRLAKLVVQLGLATEARVTLHWLPGDREAQVLNIEVPAGQSVVADQVAHCIDLSLLRSGEQFLVEDLVEVARWGHFEKADYPWERRGRI
jgi:hypothetical protein